MKHICVIKLGADGDVLRTLPLLKGIKRAHPESHITWITKGDIATLLTLVKDIDVVARVPYHGLDTFDILYNADVEKEALDLAEHLHADVKYGYHDVDGFPVSYTTGGEYYLNTMFDDDLKKTNTKTYQEMIFATMELAHHTDYLGITLSQDDKARAQTWAREHHVKTSTLIGLHMGASSRWPSKVWHPECVKAFIRSAYEKGYTVLLFGGPGEQHTQTTLVEELNKEKIHVLRNDPLNSKRVFAGLLSLCKVIVSGDSLALHLAVALRKPVVGLFFCTSPAEIESYGLVEKLVSPLLPDFFPERSDQYDEKLTRSIAPAEVLLAVEKHL